MSPAGSTTITTTSRGSAWASTGAARWWQPTESTVHAVAEHITDGGVLRGHGGGDGGLFTGILARYLDLAARALPDGKVAARLVLNSADAAWRNRGVADGGPLF